LSAHLLSELCSIIETHSKKKKGEGEMEQSAEEFAQKTWGSVELGDRRLTRRAVQLGMSMARKPEGSLATQVMNPSALEGAYRLLNNEWVTLSKLLAPSYAQTRAEAAQRAVVLWVNDMTELDYTFHRRVSGLGPIGDGKGRGLLMHTTIAIVPGVREILGLGHVEVFLRQPTPVPKPKWTRTMEARVWAIGAEAIGRAPEGVTWVEVSDAGSNFFPYWAKCLEQSKHFLIRVAQNRWVREQDAEMTHKLVDYARGLTAVEGSERSIAIPARNKQAARTAQVQMGWTGVRIDSSPQAPPTERSLPTLSAWVLRVWEPDPPEGVESIEWILLSSLPVTSLAEANERTEWYTCRWLCEDFHQCLKTGCQIERSQLDERSDLEALLGFAAPIAIRLLQLRQAAREHSDILATTLVDPLMVEVLAEHMHTDQHTMTMHQFWRLVARMGGFLGRKGDGEPGWRTVWWGWRYLSDLTNGARLILNRRT
jgi:hypothetical protein